MNFECVGHGVHELLFLALNLGIRLTILFQVKDIDHFHSNLLKDKEIQNFRDKGIKKKRRYKRENKGSVYCRGPAH